MTKQQLKQRKLLLKSLREKVAARTGGRLRQLNLVFRESRLFIFVSADCYYDAQLALVAIQKVLRESVVAQPPKIVFSVNGREISVS
jgi:hypothetical protein